MLTIGSYPGFRDASDPNPYLALFHGALASEGMEILGVCDPWQAEKSGLWPDVIHLNWPELLWSDRPPQIVKRLRRLPGGWRAYSALRPCIDWVRMNSLLTILEQAKSHGVRILWTLHNVRPHEGPTRADIEGYRRLAHLADLCIAHSHIAVSDFTACYGAPSNVLVMRHGNYAGVYPNPRPRNLVLEGLGLSSRIPTVCCLGNIRPYKGTELALEAVRMLRGEVQLVVAGKLLDGFDNSKLMSEIRSTPGVVVLPRFVDNQTFADIVTACEATLLPYREITGSGVLMASATLGTGVICSDLPYFREMLFGHPGAGMLFKTGCASELAEAIESYIRIVPEVRKAEALELAEVCSWSRVVQPVARALFAVKPD